MLLLCLIVGISDGDTLTARCGEAAFPQALSIRLAEIDAPERKQPFGEASKWHLSSLCYREMAEVRPIGRDRYGRTVARVTCRGIDANAAMVRAGMAWAFTKYQKDPLIPLLEAQARSGRLGLWADRAPVPPWLWRVDKGAAASEDARAGRQAVLAD
jgi:endonuclease YncB( thermonuclease family)